MSPKKISDFTNQLNDVILISEHSRRVAAHNVAPEYEANVARVRELWLRAGVPALQNLQKAVLECSGDFEAAARLDFDGLRLRCPIWRVEEFQTNVLQTRNFMSLALQQLSLIPAKIDKIQPRDEQPWIIRNKSSQQIEYELQSVLNAGDDVRERHERMKHQLAQLSKWLEPSSILQPASPAQGAGNVH